MFMRCKKNYGGFTLIELLVVVAIIGLLTGMVVISVRNVKAKARDAERVSAMHSIVTVLGFYHNDYNLYPIYDGYITGTDALSTALKNTGYISMIPIDPLNSDSTDCGSLTGYRYYYQSLDGKDYYLGYCLETNSIHGRAKGENSLVP